MNAITKIEKTLLEKCEENLNLAEENRNMSLALESIGFSEQEISDICYGSLMPTQKPVAILVTEDDIKARVVESYTSDSENGSKDYDDYIEDADRTNLTLWQPFEDQPSKWICEQMQNDVKSTMQWLKSFNVSYIGNKLVCVDEINLGVEHKHEGSSEIKDTGISMECFSCGSEEFDYDVSLPDLDGDFVYRTHSCKDCGLIHEERYDLVHMESKKSEAQSEGTTEEDESIQYLNSYKCVCGSEWSDEADCMCNDKCPDRNKEIEPRTSIKQ